MNNRIKALRVDEDLSQVEVAKVLGITQRKYSYIETGTQTAEYEILRKLARLYKTSIDYILCNTDVKEPYLHS